MVRRHGIVADLAQCISQEPMHRGTVVVGNSKPVRNTQWLLRYHDTPFLSLLYVWMRSISRARQTTPAPLSRTPSPTSQYHYNFSPPYIPPAIETALPTTITVPIPDSRNPHSPGFPFSRSP